MMVDETLEARRAPLRVRFETRLRALTVVHKAQITPHLLRIELSGDLTGFRSLSFDDHVKLFLPDPLTGELILPDLGREPAPDAPRPIMRDYTPVRFDADMGQLTLEFALHGHGADVGPATRWALDAKPGDTLHIGGPRGSQVTSAAFDAFVLFGDDTALPAISRRLRELPTGIKVLVVAEVDGAADRLPLVTKADASIHWVHRDGSNGPRSLVEAAPAVVLPPGDAQVWIACEAMQARHLRQYLVADRGVDARWIRAAGYWQAGAPGAHERID